ncbi:MAG: hypothetical protein JXR18_00385 [Neptuniibacter sp.]
MSSHFSKLNQIEKNLILLNKLVLNTHQQKYLQQLLIKVFEEETNQEAVKLAVLPALFQRKFFYGGNKQ